MGTFDTVYKNKLRQLEEENNKLKTALRMIFEAQGDYDNPPPGGWQIAPYEADDYDGVYPRGDNPSNISPRPANFNPAGVPFWKWIRQIRRPGAPWNPTEWQQWVDQWRSANPGRPFGNKPGRYQDFLELGREWEHRKEIERMYPNGLPPDPPVGTTRPSPWPAKPGRLGRLWRAIKPLITQGPTQNNPTQTTAPSVPNGNSQAEVM